MVKLKDIETKVEQETKVIVAQSTSIISWMMSLVTPQWAKFKAAWATWNYQKRITALVIFAITGLLIYEYVPSPLRILGRGFDSVASYLPSRSKVTPATESDMAGLKDEIINSVAATFASKADFDALKVRLDKLEAPKILVPSNIKTGSLQDRNHRKTVKITTEPAN